MVCVLQEAQPHFYEYGESSTDAAARGGAQVEAFDSFDQDSTLPNLPRSPPGAAATHSGYAARPGVAAGVADAGAARAPRAARGGGGGGRGKRGAVDKGKHSKTMAASLRALGWPQIITMAVVALCLVLNLILFGEPCHKPPLLPPLSPSESMSCTRVLPPFFFFGFACLHDARHEPEIPLLRASHVLVVARTRARARSSA